MRNLLKGHTRNETEDIKVGLLSKPGKLESSSEFFFREFLMSLDLGKDEIHSLPLSFDPSHGR